MARFVVDQGVPDPVGDCLVRHGYDVVLVRDVLGPEALDLEIAQYADKTNAIVVAWDRDFKALLNRRPTSSPNRFRHAGLLLFERVREAQGEERLAWALGLMDCEISSAPTRDDRRVFISIRPDCILVRR